jgi:hypothetical protein
MDSPDQTEKREPSHSPQHQVHAEAELDKTAESKAPQSARNDVAFNQAAFKKLLALQMYDEVNKVNIKAPGQRNAADQLLHLNGIQFRSDGQVSAVDTQVRPLRHHFRWQKRFLRARN